MGWVLDPWCHGRGYASEAVKAAIRWGEAELSAPEFSCIIDPDNRASIKVAEKAGFIQSAETTYKGGPTLVFRRSRCAGLADKPGKSAGHDRATARRMGLISDEPGCAH